MHLLSQIHILSDIIRNFYSGSSSQVDQGKGNLVSLINKSTFGEIRKYYPRANQIHAVELRLSLILERSVSGDNLRGES